jgi:recombination protein RecA
MGDSHVGLQARLMSQAMRKLTAVAARTRAIILFINQLRMKIGVSFGSPETTPGGNALRFYSSVRLDIRRIGRLKDQDGDCGNRTRVRVVKNKVAPPFRQAEFDILFGRGIHRAGELIDLGMELGLVERSGSWYSWRGKKLGQGRTKASQALIEDRQLQATLEKQVFDEAATRGLVPERRADEVKKAA